MTLRTTRDNGSGITLRKSRSLGAGTVYGITKTVKNHIPFFE